MLASADFDLDGIPDLAVTSKDTVTVMLGRPDTGFDQLPGFLVWQVHGIVAQDFNSDGRPDIATSGLNGVIGVRLGNGDGTFSPAGSYGLPGFHVESRYRRRQQRWERRHCRRTQGH